MGQIASSLEGETEPLKRVRAESGTSSAAYARAGTKFLKFSSLHFLTCGDGRQGSLYKDPPFQGLTPHFQGRSWESGGEDCQPLTLGLRRGRTALGKTPALPWTSSATWGEGRILSEPLIPHLRTTGVGVRVESNVELSQAGQMPLTELPRLRAPSTWSTSVWVLVAGSGCP